LLARTPLKPFIPLLSLVLLLGTSSVSSAQEASAYAQASPTPTSPADTYHYQPGCIIVPVAGFDGVFTVDTYYPPSGGSKCGPEVWTPAIVFLRGLSNPGIGLSAKDQYLQGIDMPKYQLFAAEACDIRGFNCGVFVVLVLGQRSGEYWNAATAVAHDLQQSKPKKDPAGVWEFMGEEPQPVSDACLIALPGDPCWGSDYVDYTTFPGP
jgi:hypothetical protein